MEKVGKMKTGKGEMEMWVEWEGRGETLATNFGETKIKNNFLSRLILFE